VKNRSNKIILIFVLALNLQMQCIHENSYILSAYMELD